MTDLSKLPPEKRFQPDLSLKADFSDNDHWMDLARKFYIRLPRYGSPPTDEKIRYWLRKFRVSEKEYLAMTGYKELAQFRELNKDWPLRAFVGLLLEFVNERDDARHVLKAYDRS